MNREALAAQLRLDEGVKLTAYLDTRRNVTVGVCHLVLPRDHIHLGQVITEAQCQAFLDADIDAALATCRTVWGPAWETYPETVQEVTTSMSFNLGLHRLRTFVMFIHAVQMRDWPRAAGHMQASLWHQQVGARAERLVTRMRAVEESEGSHGKASTGT